MKLFTYYDFGVLAMSIESEVFMPTCKTDPLWLNFGDICH